MTDAERRFDDMAVMVASGRSRRDVVRVGLGLAAASLAALFPSRATGAAFDNTDKALKRCQKFCDENFDPGTARDNCKNNFCVTGTSCPPGKQPVCGCVTPCAPPKVQNPDTCVCACPPGTTDCGTTCAATATDVNNCGACGTVCVGAPNMTPACVNGVCGGVCAAGFANCDGNNSNGCETNTRNDVNNCGACNTVCIPRPNMTPLCVNGTCSGVCAAGFANCDGNISNGCESHILTSNANCGGCGIACPFPLHCVNGVCGV